MAELPRGETNPASSKRAVSKHESARNREAHSAHHSRRNMFDRNTDSEISRSPEEIDKPKGKDDFPAARRRSSSHGRGRVRISERSILIRLSGDPAIWSSKIKSV